MKPVATLCGSMTLPVLCDSQATGGTIPGTKNTAALSDEHYRERHKGAWAPWSREWNSEWTASRQNNSVASNKSDLKTPTRSGSKRKHVILIRHGQYKLDNEINDLTERGEQQAMLTGQKLNQLLQIQSFDKYGTRRFRVSKVVHSGVTRAKQTALIAAKEISPSYELVEDPILAEGWPCLPDPIGKWEFKLKPENISAERIEAAFTKYFVNQFPLERSKELPDSGKDPSGTGGTSNNSVSEAEQTVSDEDVTIIFCHGNVIRYFLCRALQLPPEYWLRFAADNGSLTHLVLHEGGRVSLHKFGDIGHLPPSLHTYH